MNKRRVGRALFTATTATAFTIAAAFAQTDMQGTAANLDPVPAGTTVLSTGPVVPTKGNLQVVVRLSDKPLALVAGNKRTGMLMTGDQQRAYVADLNSKQSAVMAQIAALGGVEVARLNKASNAVVASVGIANLDQVSKIAGVTSVRAVAEYGRDLSQTVPYIGAAAVQALNVDGTGVRVAVLDSGIDFTHRNLGGPGTVAFYQQCYGATPNPASPATEAGQPRNSLPTGDCANYFGPNAPKVIGGYDFVGELWGANNNPTTFDPNPIDYQGHGTHVADIIAGRSADGTHKGVAPGAKLYSVKVCAAVATACNGVAMLRGVDYSLDPNGDGDISDAVDVMNMSLGLSYGQREDDSAAAVNNAVSFGVVAVVSAGNSANLPFVTGAPSIAPGAISVAQTTVPSAQGFALVVNSPSAVAGIYSNTAILDWAPLGAAVTGNIAVVGRACATGTGVPTGGDPLTSNPAGKIALVDRGTCNISEKVRRASDAGAIGVIVSLVAPGDAVSFSNGGDCPATPNGTCKPSIVVTQATGNALKAAAQPVNATLSASNAIALVGGMASTSSRGPSISMAMIKPEIGAPGASLSAQAGTGNVNTVFGGTSGAAPMVAGSAALILQANPNLQAHEVKARLMNSAETQIFTNKATLPGVLAPITRIGAGEVRVNRALPLTTGMWDAADPASVALSFGATRVAGTATLRRKVIVKNYTAAARTYTIARSYRFANDQSSAAVNLSVPATITVPANGTNTFFVTMTINGATLPAKNVNSGQFGGSGQALDLPEYDGYVTLTAGSETVSLPWHVLPHKSSNIKLASNSIAMGGASSVSVAATNAGGSLATAGADTFYLTAVSPKLPAIFQPQPGEEYVVSDIQYVGARWVGSGASSAVQFAITSHEARNHALYPRGYQIWIDVNGDGVDDFVVYQAENTGFAQTGQSLVVLYNIATNSNIIKFFNTADFNSTNSIYTVLFSDLGITETTPITYRVEAYDNYFTGMITDAVPSATITLGAPRFFVPGAAFSVPSNGTTNVTINRFAPGDTASPSQQGILVLHRDGKGGAEAEAILVKP